MKGEDRNVGDALVRVVPQPQGFAGVVILKDKVRVRLDGSDADQLWQQLLAEAAKLNPSFFGFGGARARFLRMMPQGFPDPLYIGEERAYKLRTKSKLDAALPLEAAAHWSGDGEGALAAFRATNLLSPFESTRIQEALRSPAAIPFIRAAAAFAQGETEAGLRDMAHALKPFNIAKWTAVTYLPSCGGRTSTCSSNPR